MRRVGSVLLLLAIGIQFAAGARLFDSHEQWTRTCTSNSQHFCNDVSTHDSEHCAICMVSATGPAPFRVEIPEILQVELSFVLLPHSSPIFPRESGTSCPRGPPAQPS